MINRFDRFRKAVTSGLIVAGLAAIVAVSHDAYSNWLQTKILPDCTVQTLGNLELTLTENDSALIKHTLKDTTRYEDRGRDGLDLVRIYHPDGTTSIYTPLIDGFDYYLREYAALLDRFDP